MLTERHFGSFAFPWIIFDSRNTLISRGDGCLFPIPLAAMSQPSEEFYSRAPIGWSRCPAGYAVYAASIPSLFDYRVVIPGLKVTGISTAQGRSESLSIKTDKEEIERLVARTIEGFEQAEQFFQDLMKRNVHELRQINRDIVAANEDVAHFLESLPGAEDAKNRVNNLRALSEILGSRTDFQDYLSNPSSSTKRIPIRPYQKFDKIVRSLRKRATDQGVSLHHSGNSVGYINGLPVFEVIPYIIVENAIKFSPRDYAVTVTFLEDAERIFITTQNLGPALSDAEIARVFESGFRGSEAVNNNIPGTGIGLFFLKDLVERHHQGTFAFSQSGDPIIVGGTPYRWTNVAVSFKRTR